MKYSLDPTSSMPTSVANAYIASLKNDPTYAAHLALDESPTTMFVVVVRKKDPAPGTPSGRGLTSSPTPPSAAKSAPAPAAKRAKKKSAKRSKPS